MSALVANVPADAVGEEVADSDLWTREHLTGDWRGVRTSLEERGVTLTLKHEAETWSSGFGGLQTGTIYNGLTTASLTVDLDKLISWRGAKLFVSGFDIQGHGPSTSLVGNLQLISNIEATPDVKLYDLWVEQELLNQALSIRLGQEGANDEMMITKYGALFLNSSFGFPGLPAADLPSGGQTTPWRRRSCASDTRVTRSALPALSSPTIPRRPAPETRSFVIEVGLPFA